MSWMPLLSKAWILLLHNKKNKNIYTVKWLSIRNLHILQAKLVLLGFLSVYNFFYVSNPRYTAWWLVALRSDRRFPVSYIGYTLVVILLLLYVELSSIK